MFRFFVSKVVRYLLSRLSIGKVLKRDKILFGQVIQTVPMLALVPAAQERVGFWGRTHRLGLASAIVADALWGPLLAH
jgi:hypothetical protein